MELGCWCGFGDAGVEGADMEPMPMPMPMSQPMSERQASTARAGAVWAKAACDADWAGAPPKILEWVP